MIFVTLGTQDKPFTRLLKRIEEADLPEKIVVQAGYTDFSSAKMDVRKYIEKDEFSKLLEEADLVICHAGVGTIMESLKKKKKIIVSPRLAKYGEHQNDHQLEIADTFSKQGYLLELKEEDDLKEVYEQAKNFVPVVYETGGGSFIARLSTYLDL
ncbi:MAG: hypothetical protein IIZ47_04700 [Erysipelotrichaceae bacterium]|nr:hypothetical protein [Erysipelotrichaceae bacterium]